MKPVRIVGLGGSLKEGSVSLYALERALLGAQEEGAEVELLDLRLLDLPLYLPGETGSDHPSVGRLVSAVLSADGLIWCSPVYHGSVSGSFKNALDWLELLSKEDPPYLTNKVVGLLATAGGIQGLQAVNTMEFVVRSLRGFTLPLTAPIDRAKLPLPDATLALLLKIGVEVKRAAEKLAR